MDSNTNERFVIGMGAYFFAGYNRDRRSVGLLAPTRARKFNFEEAKEQRDRFIARGFQDICVADCNGRLVAA